MNYKERKERARQLAIDWMNSQERLSWEGLAIATSYFAKLGKRYGLTQEFIENGVI